MAKDEHDPGTLDFVDDPILRVAHDLNALLETPVSAIHLDAHGRELPDPTPFAPPVGYKRPPTLQEQMKLLFQQVSYEAAMAGAETEDEANDFDVGEDMDPETPYENDFEPDPAVEAYLQALASRPPQAAAPPSNPQPATTPNLSSGPAERPLDSPPK